MGDSPRKTAAIRRLLDKEDRSAPSCSTFFVVPEDEEGLTLPSNAAWGKCHSLIHSPSGNLDSVDAVFVGFFVDKEMAMKVRDFLSNGKDLT